MSGETMNGQPLRVVQVLASLSASHGGPTRALLGLAGALRRQQVEVTLLTGIDADMLRPDDPALPLRAGRRLPLPFELPGARLLGAMNAAIRAADVVHVHSLWNGMSTAAGWLARRHGKTLVLSTHGTLDGQGMRQRARFKRLYLACIENANIAAVSGFHFLDAAERDASRWHPAVARRPCLVMPNGVDVAAIQRRLQSLPDCFAHRPDAAPAAIHLVYLGRLHAIKGLALQLEVVADLRAAGLPVHLHLIGPDHGDEASLRAQATALAMGECVHFHGALYGDERLAWLRDADAVLLTSLTEANSISAAEAFAAGGLLVATDSCNLQSAAEAGAVTQTPRTRAALVATLRRLLADTDAGRAQRVAGLRHAREQLNWDALALQMRGFYLRLRATAGAGING